MIKADVEEALRKINSLPHPLAIYIFSNDAKQVEYVLNHTLSGGVTVNDVMMHAGVHGAPFGGVGESGYGFYHGRHGLDAFSHKRTVVGPPLWLDKLMGFRYPPFLLESKAKVAVKNRLGFKKGETLKDQKIRKSSGTKVPWKHLLTVAVVACWLTGTKPLDVLESVQLLLKKATSVAS